MPSAVWPTSHDVCACRVPPPPRDQGTVPGLAPVRLKTCASRFPPVPVQVGICVISVIASSIGANQRNSVRSDAVPPARHDADGNDHDANAGAMTQAVGQRHASSGPE